MRFGDGFQLTVARVKNTRERVLEIRENGVPVFAVSGPKPTVEKFYTLFATMPRPANNPTVCRVIGYAKHLCKRYKLEESVYVE